MRKLLFALLLILPQTIVAKPAYKLVLQVDGCTDSMVLLCGYYAQNRLIYDTAYNNGKGRFEFEGSRELKPGLYFFDNLKGRSVDFVIYKEKPDFKFHTDFRDWKRNMSVTGSKQNEVFYNFQRRMDVVYDEMDAAKAAMDSATFEVYRQQRYRHIDTIRLQFIADYPDAMLSKMMLATKDPARPPDSLQGDDRYFYMMHHFFDNVPLDDDFIVRTPKEVFYERLDEYVEQRMRGLAPAQAIPLLDSLIDRSEPAPEVFKYLVHTLTEHYLQSPVMVYDEIYVHLIKRYYASGKAFWVTPSWLDKEIERAEKWERLLVGQEAPELILADTNRIAYSLHNMRGRYTLLVFWSPTCGHCRDIIPAIYKVFDRVADSLDITAFAILSEPVDETIVKWKHFIAEHHMDNPRWIHLNGAEANVDWREVYDITTTPQIYLIDNSTHRFMAKKLNADIFELICKQL